MRRVRVARVLGLVAAAVYLVGGVLQVRVDTATASFLPSGGTAYAAMEQKARDFGGDPVVVLLRAAQPRGLLTDSPQLLRLLRLEGELAALPDVAAVYGPASTLNQLATSAQNMLVQIAGRRDGLRIAAEQRAAAEGRSEPEIRAAGQEATRELTVRYAPMLVRGLPVGLPTLGNPAFAGAVIYGEDGAPREQWRAVAPDADTVAVLVRPREGLDQAGTARLVAAAGELVDAATATGELRTSGVTVSGVPVVTTAVSDRVVRDIPLVSALVAVVVALRFLLVPAPVTRRRRWLPLAAAAVGSAGAFATFGWLGHPLSFGAVALLPLLLGIGSSFPLYLSVLPDRRPVVVMALASVAAFAALALSPLPFVRDLGAALALGTLLTVAVALRRGAREQRPPDAFPEVRRSSGRRSRLAVLAAAAVVAGLGWAALPGLDVRADPRELAAGLPALADAHAAEQVLGSSGEVGIVLRGPDTFGPEARAWQRQAEDAVVAGFGDRVRPMLSPAQLFGFLGPEPTPAQVDAAFTLVPPYLSSAVVRPDRQAAVQVLGLRLQDLGGQAAMLDAMRAALPAPPPGYTAELVGLPVAAVEGYRALLADRYVVNLAGIAAAGLVLLVGLRSRRDALLAVLAAVIASGWGFALLRLLDLDLSPLTVGLGALVTVTGCEFAVLLACAGRAGQPWLHRGVAFACVTSAAGYLALVASGLEVVRTFGLVLGAAVALSYVVARLVGWAVPPAVPPTAQPVPEQIEVVA